MVVEVRDIDISINVFYDRKSVAVKEIPAVAFPEAVPGPAVSNTV